MKIVIYQVLVRLFNGLKGSNSYLGSKDENGCGKFNNFTAKALDEIKKLGATHIWFTGVLEHASCTGYPGYGINPDNPLAVKGRAGSPYAIRDYYDVCPDFASAPDKRTEEFEALLLRTHKAGMKSIIDFVPNHVARSYKSDIAPLLGINDIGCADDTSKHFSPSNNFYYLLGQSLVLPEGSGCQSCSSSSDYTEYPAKATGNDAFTATPSINDWYETVKLNYGIDYLSGGLKNFEPIPDTWHKMLEILLYWSGKGVDGFRCDMAEMVPVEFWAWAISAVKQQHPNIIFIAEVYNPNEYRTFLSKGGFDFLYDKVGLYDAVRGVMEDSCSTSKITECWQRHDEINDRMLRFLENHDEHRVASEFFSCDSWMGIPGMTVSATMHTGPVMLYFGQELGEQAADAEGFSGYDGRTSIFDYWCIDKIERWINGGAFGSSKLTESETKLRLFYSKLLNICNTELAICKGGFYDLMWCNQHIANGKLYAFIRHYRNEILLVVANFNPYTPVQFHLKFPPHLFSYLQLSFDSEWGAHELLWEEDCFSFTSNDVISEGIHLSLDKKTSAIYKLELNC
jgi:glycosidase